MTHPLLVVVAEDDYGIADLLDGLLTDEGYGVRVYHSGTEAYSAIAELPPHLVITDMQMEHKEAGLELLGRLRNDAATAQLPVILYSADVPFLRRKTSAVELHRCVVLEKPFDLSRLLGQIAALLSTGK